MVDDSAVAVLGLGDGFTLKVAMEQDGVLWVKVETTATEVGCAGCGVVAKIKGRRDVKVRDVEWAGRPAVLVWNKRVWCCPEPACAVKTWTETHDAIAPRSGWTERARRQASDEVAAGASVAAVARRYGVGWHTVMAAVRDYGTPIVDDPARIPDTIAIGVDEASMLTGTADQQATRYTTNVIDAVTGQLIEVLDGHDAATLRQWLAEQDPAWLARIRLVAIDPYEPFRAGLRPPRGVESTVGTLAHARIVADPFHVARQGGRAVDGVRRRVTMRDLGHRGRRGDALWDNRRILLMRADRLTDTGWERLHRALRADLRNEVTDAWLVYQQLLDFYADTLDEARARLDTIGIDTTGLDPAALRAAALDQIIAAAHATGIAELVTLAGTLRRWADAILAYHTHRVSNARSEAMALAIKNIKRTGRGFTNFTNYRLRLLLAHGQQCQAQPTASIRGRQPRFIA